MSHPKKVKQFIAWSKLMVDGATVEREATKSTGSMASKTRTRPSKKRKQKRRRRARRNRRMNNA